MIKCESKTFKVKELIDMLINPASSRSIDLSPPYQRGQVWKERSKREFIEDLILNPQFIHTVDFSILNNVKGRLRVLDGKQRLTALRSFAEDGVRISVLDKKKTLVFSDLKTMAGNDANINNIYLDFLDREVYCNHLYTTDIKDEVGYFTKKNKGVPLKTWQLLVSANLHLQYFLRAVSNYCLDDLDKLLPHTFKDKGQSEGIKTIAKFLMLTSSNSKTIVVKGSRNPDTLDGRFSPKNFGPDAIDNFSKNLSVLLEETCKSFTTEELIKLPKYESFIETCPAKSKIVENISYLRNSFQWFGKALKMNAVTKNKNGLGQTVWITVIAALTKLQQDKKITGKDLSDYGALKKVIVDIQLLVKKAGSDFAILERDKTSTVLDRCVVEAEIMLEAAGLNLDVKNRRLSSTDKAIAAINAPAVCPITKRMLTDANTDNDHISPNSNEVQLLIKEVNRRKQDSSKEDLLAMAAHVFPPSAENLDF